jgi:hypothetical protein
MGPNRNICRHLRLRDAHRDDRCDMTAGMPLVLFQHARARPALQFDMSFAFMLLSLREIGRVGHGNGTYQSLARRPNGKSNNLMDFSTAIVR